MTNAERIIALSRKRGLLRARDLVAKRIPRVTLTRLIRAGRIERVGRGLYSLPGADVSEHHALAAARSRTSRTIGLQEVQTLEERCD